MKKILIIILILLIVRIDSHAGTLDGNNINAWIMTTGIFDYNNNGPGFEWPKGTGQYAIFSAGLTIAAYVYSDLLMSSASYSGEYSPGYVAIVNGFPKFETNASFHIYKVKRGDNAYNNPDWMHWGQMVPYGAPFVDVNHNGIYEPLIDIPGVKNAEQTVFLCITDADPSTHHQGEGFGGGTAPMYNEVHLTAWCYNVGFLQDVQFFKWDVINKNIHPWIQTYFSIVSDPDLGCPNDDYIGYDTVNQLGFCYNGEDVDCSYEFRYSGIVPAVGIQWLNCSNIQNLVLYSFDYFTNPDSSLPFCEREPDLGIVQAYHFMQGSKSNSVPWLIPLLVPLPTKYCYTGDPETGNGWTEGLPGNPHGSIQNCYPDNEQYTPVNPPGNRKMLLNYGYNYLIVNPGDTQKIIIAQLIARGTNRLNSVTKLKQLADSVKAFACGGFIIGIKNETEQESHTFRVFPNYPNPFNPTTVINYQLPVSSYVNLTVYNVLGKKIAVLVNEKQNAGSYKVEWDADNYPSGVYFYKFSATSGTENYAKTNKMILLK